ncbi:MAG: hypothetical protein ACQETH_06155 [Candidatus Rifleibacteriota bacterium]
MNLTLKNFTVSTSLFCLLFFFCFQVQMAFAQTEKPIIEVFYKEKEPSLKTLDKVSELLENYKSKFTVKRILITEPANEQLITQRGLPTQHFPFAVSINEKTSAKIDGKTIIFAELPDFMHYVGRHKGNWTLEYLKKALENPELLLDKNPIVRNEHKQQNNSDKN